MKNSTFMQAFNGIKDPDLMFDLCIWGAYVAGNLNGKMPVEETREVFKRIKKSLKSND